MNPATDAKSAFQPLRAALADGISDGARRALDAVIAPDAELRLCHPFDAATGAQGYWDVLMMPLAAAMPDAERRDYIVIAGEDEHGHLWLGAGGFYCGTFAAPFLDIPPTGHLAHMRFHEFYRFEDGRVVETQMIWDLPEVMMQAHAWPMAPSLGREWCPPAPMTLDGLQPAAGDPARSRETRQHIIDMLKAMTRHPREPAEAMEMPRYWHERMNWYGPSGIGSARGIAGFRNWHQIPFLRAMPDRGQHAEAITHHFFGDGDYAGVTGWPDMKQTLTHDGWMGIAPAGQPLEMRSLDFWRRGPDGRIRENWVMVDLLHVYRQLGVDVMARLREFNKARPTGPITGIGDAA